MRHALFNRQRMAGVFILGFGLVSASAFAITSAPTDTTKGRAPTMSSVKIEHIDKNTNNLVDTGDELKATGEGFADLDGDSPLSSGAYGYRWNDGSSDIGTGDTYTVEAEDLGKTITAYAMPKTDPAITDPSEGDEVSASISAAAGDTVVAVAITGLTDGHPVVGTPVTANPTCLSGACGTVAYQWQIEDAVGSGSYSDIAGADEQQYMPKGGDQRRKLRVTAE